MLAIISDIHGNYPALTAVMKEIGKLGCSRIISLGDVAGYYCMVNECVELLQEKNIVNILGNHDRYLLKKEKCPRSYSANMCLEYQQQIVTKSSLAWLVQSVEKIEIANMSMVHGGWNDYVDEYLYEIKPDEFLNRPELYYFAGHTHVQYLRWFSDKVFCNPGAVGQPRDGNPMAAFAVLDHGTVTLHRVGYDVELICDKMAQAGFAARFYENLYSGTKIGGEVAQIYCQEA